MDKKRIHDLELLSDLSEITESDYLIIDDENETTSKKISALMLKDALTKPIISPEVAQIGQTIVVKEIDTKGKPIVWEAINLPDNNINYIETDPTVPEWAKQPYKPEYTAEEVGALPDDTEIPSLEGLATERYVNDKISEIKIPEIDLSGYSTEKYVDDAVADKITIPTSAEIGQTIVVSEVDENGKPTKWESVDLSKNDNTEWKLLKAIELSEDTASIYFDIDDEGNSFECKEIFFRGRTTAADGTTTTLNIKFNTQNAGDPFFHGNSIVKNDGSDYAIYAQILGEKVSFLHGTSNAGVTNVNTLMTYGRNHTKITIEKITSVVLATGSGGGFASGSTFYVYGR